MTEADGAAPEPGFRPATDLHYIEFLTRLHAAVPLDWYLEIGCRSGHSLSPARCRTIGVDPDFALKAGVQGSKPELLLFQTTSDAFFSTGFLERNAIRLSLSFIDGMHLVEYVLRDFINLERRSRPGGAIMIHDCCPWTHDMTTREVPAIVNRAWTGDVWKIVPILARWRPELSVMVLGCRPTGLAIVGGLDPENRVLADAYREVLAEYGDLTLRSYGPERFFGGFDYVPAGEVEAAGFGFLDGVRLGR